jgi:tetratricopeptide (TPR) repeat protein
MSKHDSEIRLDLPLSAALDACDARERREMARSLRRDSQFVYLGRKVSPDEAQRMLYVPSADERGLCEVERLIQRSRKAVEERRYEEAEHWADQAVVRDPLGDDCWGTRAQCRWYMGDFDQALPDYERAVALAPAETWRHAEHLFGRGQVHLVRGDPEGALRDLEKALAVDDFSGSAAAQGALGLALVVLKRAQEAGKAFKKARETEPEDARVYFYLGRSEHFLGNHNAAARAYSRALQCGGSSLPSWMEAEARGYLKH